jgi:hypothetical protein
MMNGSQFYFYGLSVCESVSKGRCKFAFILAFLSCLFVPAGSSAAPSGEKIAKETKNPPPVSAEEEEICPEDLEKQQLPEPAADNAADKGKGVVNPVGKVWDPHNPTGGTNVGGRFSRYSGNDGYENYDGIPDEQPRAARRKSSSKNTSASRGGGSSSRLGIRRGG